jgi:hypothetical protein
MDAVGSFNPPLETIQLLKALFYEAVHMQVPRRIASGEAKYAIRNMRPQGQEGETLGETGFRVSFLYANWLDLLVVR